MDRQIEFTDWEKNLVEDLRRIIFEAMLGVFKKWHEVGSRTLKDEEYLTRKYGDSYVVNLAEKIEISERSLWRSIQFVKKYPNLKELEETVMHDRISWYQFVHKMLPEHPQNNNEFKPQLYNVWNVFNLDENYGSDYPGRTPHQIIANLLHYYTNEGALVVDPMAGGGTIIDVCKEMNRKYVAFDIKPRREDIIQNDVLHEIPLQEKCDFVFLDPPYYDLMEEYIQNEWNESYSSFLKSMEQTLKNIKPILSGHGKVALLLKPMNEKMLGGEWLDLTLDSINIAKELGYKVIKRISTPLSTQQFKSTDVIQAKEKRVMLNTLRDIVVLEVAE